MEYTKGEWELEIQDEDNATIRLKNGEIEVFGDNTKANAHLISASPDLYEELKDALQEICRLCVRLNPQHENCTSCEDMEQRRKAIAKADGTTEGGGS